MSAPIVRAHYDQLDKVSGSFGQNAELTRKTLQSLRGQQEALQAGDWVGSGAQAFYAEMNSQVLPAINRLVEALEAAHQTTAQIRDVLHQAEDECARVLRANGTGAAGLAAGAAAGLNGGAARSSGGNGSAAAGGMSAFSPQGGAASSGGVQAAAKPKAGAGFAPDTTPLPNPQNLKWYGDVINADGSGQRVPGSQAMSRWGSQFKQQWGSINDQRQDLDNVKAILAKTLKEQGDVVRAASQNMQAMLDRLNKLTSGRAHDLIKTFEHRAADAKVAAVNAGTAGKNLESAQHRLEAVKQATAQFEAGQSKKGWEGQRDEINARIKERQELIGKVVDLGKAAAGANTAEAVTGLVRDQGADLLKMVIGGMTDSEMKELIAAESNISKYDELMNKAAERVLHEQSAAARLDVDAATGANRAAQMTVQNTQKAERDTLDQLATLEREQNTGHLFRDLKQYDENVRAAGNELNVQAGDYLKTLRNPPLGNAALMSQVATEDIKHVNVYGGGGNQDWQDTAQGTRQYLNQLDRWQQGEVAAHTQIQQDLAQGKHLNLVTSTIESADRALGGNPDTEDIANQPTAR